MHVVQDVCMTALRKINFANGLFIARTSRGLSQHAMHSRVYVSNLERAVKQPTVGKVDELAEQLGLHPMTLLCLGYMTDGSEEEVDALLTLMREEVIKALKNAGPKRAPRTPPAG